MLRGIIYRGEVKPSRMDSQTFQKRVSKTGVGKGKRKKDEKKSAGWKRGRRGEGGGA